jgi:hypothetical protein
VANGAADLHEQLLASLHRPIIDVRRAGTVVPDGAPTASRLAGDPAFLNIVAAGLLSARIVLIRNKWVDGSTRR